MHRISNKPLKVSMYHRFYMLIYDSEFLSGDC